jgi:hypothetical protein
MLAHFAQQICFLSIGHKQSFRFFFPPGCLVASAKHSALLPRPLASTVLLVLQQQHHSQRIIVVTP